MAFDQDGLSLSLTLPFPLQDRSEHLLASPRARLPAGGHGGAAAVRGLPALPGRPLRGGRVSPLPLPRGPGGPVRQMREAHQRCGAQGEAPPPVWSATLFEAFTLNSEVTGRIAEQGWNYCF